MILIAKYILRGMERPLKEHLGELERRLEKLNKRLMESTRNRAECNKVESEIMLVSIALEYYRKAIHVEKIIS
jgi:hypothetical protein